MRSYHRLRLQGLDETNILSASTTQTRTFPMSIDIWFSMKFENVEDEIP